MSGFQARLRKCGNPQVQLILASAEPHGGCAGGELQRFAIAVVAAQSADIYMIDEPSSYLDVRQRLKAAQVT